MIMNPLDIILFDNQSLALVKASSSKRMNHSHSQNTGYRGRAFYTYLCSWELPPY